MYFSVFGLLAWLFPLVLVGAIVCTCIPRTRTVGKALFNVLLFLIMGVGSLIVALLIAFITPRPELYSLLWLAVVLLAFAAISAAFWGVRSKKVYLPLLAAFGVCVAVSGGFIGYDAYVDSIPTVDDGGNLIYQYAPYGADSKVVVLPEPATLQLTDELPRLDGATALFPIYSAFARATYPAHALTSIQYFEKAADTGDNPLLCTTTPEAYRRLMEGEADMIFVASASKSQQETAKQLGVELVFTPIGREAFVFFVNAKNPVEGLTLSQIQDIYEGKTTGWAELGVRGMGNIKAFQRPEDSGSQTTLQKLMEGRTLMTPPIDTVAGGMGDIISRTADYRNFRSAIGYSFRFYATEMVQNDQIKLLAVDGVLPTKETICDGSYPIASDFYAVTTTETAALCQPLLQWILSPQGQAIVEQTGYVGAAR